MLHALTRSMVSTFCLTMTSHSWSGHQTQRLCISLENSTDGKEENFGHKKMNLAHSV